MAEVLDVEEILGNKGDDFLEPGLGVSSTVAEIGREELPKVLNNVATKAKVRFLFPETISLAVTKYRHANFSALFKRTSARFIKSFSAKGNGSNVIDVGQIWVNKTDNNSESFISVEKLVTRRGLEARINCTLNHSIKIKSNNG